MNPSVSLFWVQWVIMAALYHSIFHWTQNFKWLCHTEATGRNCIKCMSSFVLLPVGAFLMKKKCNGDGLPSAMKLRLGPCSPYRIWQHHLTINRVEKQLLQFQLCEQSKGWVPSFTPKLKCLEANPKITPTTSAQNTGKNMLVKIPIRIKQYERYWRAEWLSHRIVLPLLSLIERIIKDFHKSYSQARTDK